MCSWRCLIASSKWHILRQTCFDIDTSNWLTMCMRVSLEWWDTVYPSQKFSIMPECVQYPPLCLQTSENSTKMPLLELRRLPMTPEFRIALKITFAPFLLSWFKIESVAPAVSTPRGVRFIVSFLTCCDTLMSARLGSSCPAQLHPPRKAWATPPLQWNHLWKMNSVKILTLLAAAWLTVKDCFFFLLVL